MTTTTLPASTRSTASPVFLVFAAFGSFWGTWGAAVPRIREQANIDDAQLGIALLFVGAGALPAMLLTGRASDRWGSKVAGSAIIALGLSGLVLAVLARDFISLCAALAVVGATSGASDVAINAMAGQAEQRVGRPIITRAHGVFSSFVVVSSVGTGILSSLAVPVTASFGIVALVSSAGGALVARVAADPTAGESEDTLAHVAQAHLAMAGLVLVGLLGAFAFASENAHQSWGAAFLEDELDSGPGFSALAPAVFAAVIAVTRFSIGSIRPDRAVRVLLIGSTAAVVGALILSVSTSIAVAALGLAIAAAGTAVLFPTLIGVVSSRVSSEKRGRAISMVTTVSYLGFLLGPVYVGVMAGMIGLRGAMAGVAVLGAVLFLLSPFVLRKITRHD